MKHIIISPAANAAAFATELVWLAETLDAGLLAGAERAAVVAAAQGLLDRLGATAGPAPTGADELTDLGISYAAVDAALRRGGGATARQPGRVCPVCLGLTVDRAGRCGACRPAAWRVWRRASSARLANLIRRAAWFREG